MTFTCRDDVWVHIVYVAAEAPRENLSRKWIPIGENGSPLEIAGDAPKQVSRSITGFPEAIESQLIGSKKADTTLG
jgi:hypothetical protein